MKLNRGVYHPALNRYGCKMVRVGNGDYFWDNVVVHNIIVTRNDCFDQTKIALQESSGRPDNLFLGADGTLVEDSVGVEDLEVNANLTNVTIAETLVDITSTVYDGDNISLINYAGVGNYDSYFYDVNGKVSKIEYYYNNELGGSSEFTYNTNGVLETANNEGSTRVAQHLVAYNQGSASPIRVCIDSDTNIAYVTTDGTNPCIGLANGVES